MKEFVVVLPRGATGGVELGHQLVDVINKKTSYSAYVLYYPFEREGDVTAQYKGYECKVINLNDLSGLHNKTKVILPETYTYLTHKFSQFDIAVWWMSVDNYFGSMKLRFAIGNRFIPFTYERQFGNKSRVKANLYQSEYARLFLQSKGVENVFRLSDFLNDSFFKHCKSKDEKRQHMVLYNPAKGEEYTRKIIAASPAIEYVPIRGYTPSEVKSLMQKAMVYIDFGGHPGKDRIPREAAVSGCCVLVGRRGSALNDVDIMIPDEFKFSVAGDFDENLVTAKISEIFVNFESETRKFDQYRNQIFLEKAQFNEDVISFCNDF